MVDVVAMEPALALLITVALCVMFREVGCFWAFVITVLLWAFLDLDGSGLLILAFLTVGEAVAQVSSASLED